MTTVYEWRGAFTNQEVNALHAEAFKTRVFVFDQSEWNWAELVHRHSLGWVRVVAREGAELVGFVNVLWDGLVHAWLQDTMVAVRARGVSVPSLSLVPAMALRRRDVGTCTWTSRTTCGPSISALAVSRRRMPGCCHSANPQQGLQWGEPAEGKNGANAMFSPVALAARLSCWRLYRFEIAATAVARQLEPDVPVHFTAFHPDFKMWDRPPTPRRRWSAPGASPWTTASATSTPATSMTRQGTAPAVTAAARLGSSGTGAAGRVAARRLRPQRALRHALPGVLAARQERRDPGGCRYGS